MALQYNLRPSLRKWLRSDQGWLDFTIGFTTESGSLDAGMSVRQGKVKVLRYDVQTETWR